MRSLEHVADHSVEPALADGSADHRVDRRPERRPSEDRVARADQGHARPALVANDEHPDSTFDDDLRYPTVVIAVDGQPASVSALDWARDHLIGPDHQVVAVTAHVLPMAAPDALLATFDARAVENTARVHAEEALRATFGVAATRIHHVVEAGAVEEMLERHAGDDAIVVVGAPARRRLRDRFRPPIARRLAGQLHCPVVIVPERDDLDAHPAHAVSPAESRRAA